MDNKELYAKAFVYPSHEEYKEIIDSFPVIKELAFRGRIKVKDNLYDNKIDTLIANDDILAWINRLNDKFSKLRFSYVLAKYYKLKGIPDARWIEHLEDGTKKYFPDFKNKGDYYNNFLFNHSCESFYYHYVSGLDILMHLINIYYNLGVEEKSHRFNEHVGKKLELKNSKLFNILKDFRTTNGEIYKDRNDLAHNFAFYVIDNRSQKVRQNESDAIHLGLDKYTTSDEVMNNIEQNINSLSLLFKAVEKELE